MSGFWKEIFDLISFLINFAYRGRREGKPSRVFRLVSHGTGSGFPCSLLDTKLISSIQRY